jgi:hypothetical protein
MLYKSRTNFVMADNGDLFADYHNILNIRTNYFCQLFNVHEMNNAGRLKDRVSRRKVSKIKKLISRKLSHMYPIYVIGKEHCESFFQVWLTHVRQLVTFGELSNDVDTIGTGSMRVVVSRVPITCGCPVSF